MADVKLRDGHTCDERWACHCQDCDNHPDGPLFAEERYSLGIYAGKMCDAAWKNSGYRDEPESAFDTADAGECFDAESVLNAPVGEDGFPW